MTKNRISVKIVIEVLKLGYYIAQRNRETDKFEILTNESGEPDSMTKEQAKVNLKAAVQVHGQSNTMLLQSVVAHLTVDVKIEDWVSLTILGSSFLIGERRTPFYVLKLLSGIETQSFDCWKTYSNFVE